MPKLRSRKDRAATDAERPARRGRRLPAGLRLIALAFTIVTLAMIAGTTVTRSGHAASPPAAPVPVAGRTPLTGRAGTAGPGGHDDRTTLVLYDTGQRRTAQSAADPAEAASAELYAMFTANLVSRATAWQLRPVTDYQRGSAAGFQSVVYVGSIYDEVLPAAFLDDVLGGQVPTVWIGANIWQLFERSPKQAKALGWTWTGYRQDSVTAVDYKGVRLPRPEEADSDIMGVRVTDPRKVQVLADAVSPEGTRTPWALRSGRLTYLAEVPYSYASTGDRSLAAADVLLGALAPDTPERHRALIRIEDVGPRTEPARLRAIVDELAGKGVPFTLAVYPYYVAPPGTAREGRPAPTARLVDRPQLVATLRYALERGGSLVMSGYTGPNPAEPDTAFADHLATGLGEFRRVGLPEPAVYQFPQYTGSAADYATVNSIFGLRYDRGSYYPGYCAGGRCGSTPVAGSPAYRQYFPYPVRDVYGSVVIPENVGTLPQGNYDPRAAQSTVDLLGDARSAKVVRDNVAGFRYHPDLGPAGLGQLVDSVRALGYQFAATADVLRG